MAAIELDGIVLDCPDDLRLAQFYRDLTGMDITVSGDAFPEVSAHGVSLLFQKVKGYQPSTWPTQERGQQLHLEFVTDDVKGTISYAESIGARIAFVPPDDDSAVMLDPAGHPFCIATPFTDLAEYARRREIVREGTPTITLAGVDFDCPELVSMIRFYIGLTGMEYREIPGEYPKLVGEQGLLYLFQQVDEYRAPTWPTQERGQQMHLDYRVDDLEAAVSHAESVGATVIEQEPGRYFAVLADPAGHPFCLANFAAR
ncbi:MAG TPA: VOC family protein [Thermomicrobiales bacterium]|nr:VOC family protein [Thermomicrobiales bacterium]